MKKVAPILLICIYSLATMGFTLKQFYCCGKLKSITFSLTQQAKDKCAKGDDKSGCCDSKFQFFKVKDNHISADQTDFPVKHFVALHPYTPSFQDISFVSQKSTIAYKSNAAPLRTGVPIYIYNCIFRIWFLPFFSAITFCYAITIFEFINSIFPIYFHQSLIIRQCFRCLVIISLKKLQWKRLKH